MEGIYWGVGGAAGWDNNLKLVYLLGGWALTE